MNEMAPDEISKISFLSSELLNVEVLNTDAFYVITNCLQLKNIKNYLPGLTTPAIIRSRHFIILKHLYTETELNI